MQNTASLTDAIDVTRITNFVILYTLSEQRPQNNLNTWVPWDVKLHDHQTGINGVMAGAAKQTLKGLSLSARRILWPA